MRQLIRRHPRILAAALLGPLVVANLVVRGPAPAPLAGPADAAAVDAWLEAQVRDAGIPGAAVVVVQDGRIVHERGFGTADPSGRPVSATTPFVIGSLSKSMTALAVLQLVDAGRVELDAPIRRYLPEFTVADSAAADRITVRELLDHTSGLSTAIGQAPLARPSTSLDAHVRELAGATLASAPGTRYAYSNANYLVLGRLVEVVSGVPFGAYLAEHVFGPLGMAHASTDRAIADANGLTDAYRLWFGLAVDRRPADRPDMVPAGWISASADDLGRFLIAQLDDGRYAGRAVVSAQAIRTMQAGTVETGLPDERMGMGWVESLLDGERIVSHAGSTTEMAAIQVLVPGRRLGVAVLFNAQSTIYELLHKPEAIGLGVASLLIGREPAGTFQALYPVLDLVVIVVLLLLVHGLVRLIRAPVTDAPIGWAARSGLGRAQLVGWWASRAYLDAFAPLVILVKVPELLGAGWAALIRTDLGLVVLAIAILRLADGGIRVARLGLTRRAARAVPARSAALEPSAVLAPAPER